MTSWGALVFILITAGRSVRSGLNFVQEILSLCHTQAVYRVSNSYYACNWSKVCGGGGVVFSLAQAEQYIMG